MSIVQVITAIYEDGIFRPLYEIDLRKRQVVRLIILPPQRSQSQSGISDKAMDWKDFFATKLEWCKNGPLDLSEVSIDALWL